jgi:hypothetical protein
MSLGQAAAQPNTWPMLARESLADVLAADWRPRFAIALTIAIARRPEAVLRPSLWADDGPQYVAARLGGLESVFEPFHGFLIVGQRLAMAVVAIFPPELFPLVATWASLLVLASVSAFLGSSRMDTLNSDPVVRLSIGAAVVLVPASYEVFGTISHLQWVIGLFLIGYAYVSASRRWELALLLIAGLTGPIVIFVFLLYVLRLIGNPSTFDRVAVLGLAAAIQLFAYASEGVSYVHPPILVGDALISIVEHVTQLPWIAGAPVFLVAALVAHPRRIALMLSVVGLSIAAAGILRLGVTGATVDTRYYWIAGWVLLCIILSGRHGLARKAGLAMVAGLILGTFRLPPGPPANTQDIAMCVGSVTECSVPIVQGVNDPSWTMVWPGTR